MRRILVFSWLLLILGVIAAFFWYNEWVYNLPTPVPKSYKAIAAGERIELKGISNDLSGKPLFLHFFNPDCPCSRFNIKHVRLLVKQYQSVARFKLVLVSNKHYTEEQIQKRFDINIPVIPDKGLAAACGVYSTPQAVIVDAGQHLFYRGNYNRSRYCTDKNSNYAQQALEALQKKNYTTQFAPLAVKAYGCSLPGCAVN